MKLTILISSIALALAACSPASAPDPNLDVKAKRSAPAEATAPAASEASPPSNTEEPIVSADSSDPKATAANPGEANDVAGRKAVNDAIDASLGDHEKYQQVIEELKKSVAANDAAAVAELVDYPISVSIKGKDTVLKDKQAFVSHYKDFMSTEISKAILDTKYGDLFVNARGVMFGDGQAWINGICKDDACNVFEVKLITLQSEP